jgi:hypothetical protein
MSKMVPPARMLFEGSSRSSCALIKRTADSSKMRVMEILSLFMNGDDYRLSVLLVSCLQ